MADRRPIHRVLDTSPAVVGLGLALVAVVLPGAWVVGEIVRGLAREGLSPRLAASDVRLLVRSLATAGAIAFLATIIAWPAAWAMRARPRLWTPLIVVSLLLPPYLAYSGWGLARSPGTLIGDWLARGPPTGPNWWLPLAGKTLAIVGLALWAWPAAALALGAGARQVDQGALDAARLESASATRTLLLRAAMVRRSLLAAFAAVVLVMFGSAVPLHVAQLETAAIRVWRLLDQTAPERHWAVWLSVWPLLAVAILGASVITARALRGADAGISPEPASRGRDEQASHALAAATVAASTLTPLVLFALFLRDVRSLAMFLRVESDAIATSAGIAVATGGLCTLLGVAASWFGAGDRAARRVGAVTVHLFACACVVPGILVGHATLTVWLAGAPGVADTPAPLVLSHLARFGVVAVWIGWAAARAEPADRRDLRRLDGGGLGAWARVCLAEHWRLIAAGGIACGVLSLHEIEASVVVAPPGARLLARDMLGFLHFFRQEELCAGAILLVVAGFVAGAGAFWLGRPSLRKTAEPNRNGPTPSTV